MSTRMVDALVLHGSKDLRLEQRPLPPPEPLDLQISLKRTGLCGSDLHYYNHYRNGDILVREPLVLGHESSGIVTAIGSLVPPGQFSIGDAVALEVGVPCEQGNCAYCNPASSTTPQPAETHHDSANGTTPYTNGTNGHHQYSSKGTNGTKSHQNGTNGIHTPSVDSQKRPKPRYNLCPRLRFRSSAKSFPHYQGTLQTTLNHPARYCHKLPASISTAPSTLDSPLTLASLLEPLSVALHAIHRSGLSGPFSTSENHHSGPTILIFGAGAVGLLCAYVARMKGAGIVVVADIDAGRVKFAVEKGFADRGFVVSKRRGQSVEEKLGIAKDVAGGIKSLQRVEEELKGYSNGGMNGYTNGANGADGHGDGVSNGYLSHENGIGEVVGEVDITFECTGVESAVQAAIYATKPGGKVMLVGMGNPIQTLPLGAAALREVDLLGVFRYAGTYEEGIKMVMGGGIDGKTMGNGANGAKEMANGTNGWQDGIVNGRGRSELPDLEALVTHRFVGLERASDAFRMAGKTMDEDTGGLVLKVMIELN